MGIANFESEGLFEYQKDQEREARVIEEYCQWLNDLDHQREKDQSDGRHCPQCGNLFVEDNIHCVHCGWTEEDESLEQSLRKTELILERS